MTHLADTYDLAWEWWVEYNPPYEKSVANNHEKSIANNNSQACATGR